MGIRKKTSDIYDRTELQPSENNSAPLNPSHKVDDYTNFVLRSITLENLDESIYRAFNNRFLINNKNVGLIMLDTEIATLRHEKPESFDDFTEYLKLPYFTCWRTNDEQLFRTNPSHKRVIYAQPVEKAQGIVYEEYISKAPKFLKVFYTIKFITTMREYANQYEEQMFELFENKRILITLDRERFHLQPVDKGKVCDLETSKRGGEGKTFYTLTSNLELWAYIRNSKDVQKRERPNTFNLTVKESSGDFDTIIYQSTVKLNNSNGN